MTGPCRSTEAIVPRPSCSLGPRGPAAAGHGCAQEASARRLPPGDHSWFPRYMFIDHGGDLRDGLLRTVRLLRELREDGQHIRWSLRWEDNARVMAVGRNLTRLMRHSHPFGQLG